jgi:hypothetical protein
MCIGDATAQQTRPGLSGSVERAASISLSTSPLLTLPRWNFFAAIGLPPAKARFGSDRLSA